MRTRKDIRRADDGIALVIVLGILSILLILGVAFATALRTDQIATRNSIDSLRARQFIDAAVAAAMDEIDSRRDPPPLGDSNFFMTSPSQATADRVIRSTGGGETISASDILSGTAGRYLPRGVTNDVLAAGSAQWQAVSVPALGATPALDGRIAFVAVDVSDYVDANLAAGWTRNYGTNMGEIALLDVQNLNGFTNDRETAWGEFDTLPDIEMLAAPYLQGGENFLMLPYSLYPSNYWNAATGNETRHFDIRTAISGTSYSSIDKDSINLGTIEQAIRDSAIDPAISTDPTSVLQLAANIRDYLDNDNVPGNGQFSEPYSRNPAMQVQAASICTEAVPMINEVRLANQLRTVVAGRGRTNWISRILVDVELWFPFVGVNTSADDFEVELRGLLIGPMDPTPELNFLIRNEKLDRRQSGNGYYVYSIGYPPTVQEKIATTLPDYSRARGVVEIAVLETSTGELVDHLYFEIDDWKTEMFQPSDLPNVPPSVGSSVIGQLDQQADDPRINWDWHDTAQWNLAEFGDHSLGASNDKFLTYDETAPDEKDGDTVMFVRNGMYRSPGELGQLLYDATRPWQTIRLLGPDPRSTSSLVEHFAASTNEQGYVNLNTGDQEILASAFVNSPVRRVPDEPPTTVLQLNEAMSVAGAILAKGINTGKEFKNRADLSRNTYVTSADLIAASSKISNGVIAENVISDTYGLLGTRQNLFVVLAVAQVFAPKSAVVTSERRAVALVWRDPLPNSDDARSRHTAFVRNLVWLNE